MRTLIVTPWYGGNEGGVSVVVEALSEALTTRGVDVDVGILWPRTNHAARFGEVLHQFDLYSPDIVNSPRGWVAYWRRSIRCHIQLSVLHHRRPFDLVHLHYVVPAMLPVLRWCVRRNIPVVCTAHGSDVNRFSEVEIGKDAMLEIWRSANSLTAVSDALAQNFERLLADAGSSRPVECIPNPITPDTLSVASTHQTRDIDLVFVGNLRVEKGPDLLIAALKQGAFEQRIRLVVAGDGPLRGELQEQAATLKHCDVEFVGRLERPEIMSLFDRAKVVVIPSRSEGLPLVALEAQVRGARVICSEIGGLPQAVRKCTDYQFFDPHEIDQITTAIECALAEANADALVAAAREHVLSQFSPERIAITYGRVYAAAIADAERAER